MCAPSISSLYLRRLCKNHHKKNYQKLILITHECSPKMEHQTFRKVLWSLEDIRRVSIICEAWDDPISREAMHRGKIIGK